MWPANFIQNRDRKCRRALQSAFPYSFSYGLLHFSPIDADRVRSLTFPVPGKTLYTLIQTRGVLILVQTATVSAGGHCIQHSLILSYGLLYFSLIDAERTEATHNTETRVPQRASRRRYGLLNERSKPRSTELCEIEIPQTSWSE